MSEPKHPEAEDVPHEVQALHPIVLTAFSLLQPGEEGEEYMLPEPLVHDLHSGILQYAGDEELAHVVHSLTAMALTMRDQHNSPTLAAQLIAVLESDEVAQAVKALSIAADPEAVEAAAERFAAFAGRAQPKTAPRGDEPKPEGSITLDKINFPRRM